MPDNIIIDAMIWLFRMMAKLWILATCATLIATCAMGVRSEPLGVKAVLAAVALLAAGIIGIGLVVI